MPPFSTNPVIYECQERRAVEDLPLSQVLSSNGVLDILPSSKGYFDIDYRGSRLILVAGRYVGLIPINSRVLIDVKPKMPIQNLLHLVDIAGEELGALNFFERGYPEKPTFDQSVLDLLIKTLLKQLRLVEQEGLYKVYRRDSKTGPYHPKINFARTVQTHWSRGNFTRTTFDVFEYSRDNCLNRLVKYTLWYAGKFLQLKGASGDRTKTLTSFYDLFERVPLDISLSFLRDAQRMLKNHEIPALRAYYNDIVRTCLLIVGNRSVSLDLIGNDVSLLSFVLNLEDVFEKYVRNLLRLSAPQLRPELRILNGNDVCSYLFRDSKSIRIKPDIIIQKEREMLIVSDVKYKPKLSETDRYQIITHALSMSASKAVLIVPSFLGGPSGLIRRGRVGRDPGIELFEYHLRVDDALEVHEKAFSAEILAMA